MTGLIFWVSFLTGAVFVLGPGVVNPYAPFNGLSLLGVALLVGATLFAASKGGE